MTDNSKSRKNFLNGALILTAALFIVKAIGFFYKIPLFRLIGGEGWGYYNDAYQIYALMFVISTAGIPVAIAKLVSESNAVGRINEPKKILSLSLKVFTFIGLLCTLILFFYARLFAEHITKTPESTLSIMAIAPAVFFVSLGASFKGYFQGYKNMTPTAIYQIIEATTKLLGLVVVAVLIALGYKDNPTILACGAVMGVTIGSMASSTFMFIRFYFGKAEIETQVKNPIENRSNSAIFRAMLKIAVPVTISSSVLSLTSVIDLAIVKNALITSGLSPYDANMVYGSYSGCCYSLFNFPPSLTQNIGISVFPFISSLFSSMKYDEAYENMDSSMRIVSLIAVPCAVGMSFFSKPILNLLYSGRNAEIEIAAPAFAILSLGIFLVAMTYHTNIFLQACGKTNIPMFTMLIGALFKIVVNWTLVSKPDIRINGAPFGTLVCYGSIVILNLIMLWKSIKYRPDFISVFVKPIAASVISIGLAFLIFTAISRLGIIPNSILALVSIMISGLLYLVCIFAIRAVNKFDIMMLPSGDKICSILTKRGLLKDE